MKEAEKFVKSITQENQKDVLNYIRQVAYNRDFLKDPYDRKIRLGYSVTD